MNGRDPLVGRRSTSAVTTWPGLDDRRQWLAWAGLLVLSGCASPARRAPVATSIPGGWTPLDESVAPDEVSARLLPGDTPDHTVPGREVPDHVAREITFLALSLIDTPYRYGGNTPESGFDCSGLIVYVYREIAGMILPRTVARLARTGRMVPASAMRTGDLLLFDTSGRFTHAGIFVGDARFVHAPSTGGTVRLDTIRTPYWRTRFSGVRRI